jgi:large subunit ribosomal protein L24
MVKVKIKKGDKVIITTGRDKGKTGEVKSVLRSGSGRVKLLVDGINIVKKHVKGNPQAGDPGGIKEKEAPIDVSNVMLFNAMTNRGERIGYRILEDGKKARYFKSSGDMVDVDKK